jgi:hypothetical protein
MGLAFSRLALVAGFTAFGLSVSACGDDGADGTGGDDSTSPAASSGSGSTGTGECLGVVEDGVCVGKCDPTTCTVGNICVGNRCTLPCDGAVDCYPGTSCQETTDDGGATVKACLTSGKSPILGATCYFGNECAAATVCPDGTACGASLCGGGACTDGKCPDGSVCTPQTCDAAACRAPRCYGAVPDAVQSPSASTFCTQDDCTSDSDCIQGMYCAKTRDWHEVCGRDDIPTFRPDEGDCIDPADFNTDGKTFEIGTITLLRNTCLPREQCAPCETDLDCSGKLGQVCAQIGGEGRCASQCAANSDCGREAACEPDPAHAGMNVCTPKYGSCIGEGEFCGPCNDDLDCGGPESPFVCDVVSMFYDAIAPQTPSEISAQRGCFDLTFPDACPDGTDQECPAAPNGLLRGECLNGSDGYTPSDDLYERCFVPLNDFSLRFQCW